MNEQLPLQSWLVEVQRTSTYTVEVKARTAEEARESYVDEGTVIHSEGHPQEVKSVSIKGQN